MSSLLDILQKRTTPPTTALETSAPAPAASHMQTVELHLAVDNRGMGEQPAVQDAAQGAEADFRIAVQDEGIAAEAAPAAYTAAGIAAEAAPAETPAEATQSLLLSQRRLRVRRNTSLLIGSLVVILLAVTTAISIVMQYAADRDSAQAVVIPPEAVPSAPVQPVAGNPAEQPAVRPLRKEVTSTQAAVTRTADEGKDPDWYDSPAIEPQAGTTAITISRGTSKNPLFPKLSAAWNAFQAADYPAAENLYREVRAADATNVDAMLGLAAIALRAGRDQEAQALYNEVLAADPQNPAAIAALSTLPGGASATGDTGNETRLKNLLREHPAAAELHFALGLQYVGGGRWPEAQQAFFDAVRNAPANADYAYNLAVSLDQLGQGAAAAAYYERALDLAGGSALFDTMAARQRLESLRATAP